MAHRYGARTGVFQFEDDTHERVLEQVRRYAMRHVEGCDSEAKADDWARQHFFGLPRSYSDQEPDFNLQWLITAIRIARLKYGCLIVLVDPWNELEHIWHKGETETVYVNNALRDIKRLTRAYDVIVNIITHPSMAGGRTSSIEWMNLYSVAGSAAWNNKADVGIVVHRPDQAEPETYVKVSKTKDHIRLGKPGIVRLKYDIAAATYRYIGMGVDPEWSGQEGREYVRPLR
jgi:twinkle protein